MTNHEIEPVDHDFADGLGDEALDRKAGKPGLSDVCGANSYVCHCGGPER